MPEFTPEEGEEIIEKIKPSKRLLFYFILAGLMRSGLFRPAHGPEIISAWVILLISLFLILTLFVIVVMLLQGIPLISPSDIGPGYILGALILFSIVDAIFLTIPYLMYKRRIYYITNKRIVIMKGVIRSSMLSIPLGRITPSSIWISNTFLERICGFRSIYFGDEKINPTKSMFVERGSIGDLPILYAVPEPERVKELILNLAKSS